MNRTVLIYIVELVNEPQWIAPKALFVVVGLRLFYDVLCRIREAANHVKSALRRGRAVPFARMKALRILKYGKRRLGERMARMSYGHLIDHMIQARPQVEEKVSHKRAEHLGRRSIHNEAEIDGVGRKVILWNQLSRLRSKVTGLQLPYGNQEMRSALHLQGIAVHMYATYSRQRHSLRCSVRNRPYALLWPCA